jgi:hypothetical protein
LISYIGGLASKTSWSHDYIVWELPFSEGMRILDYHTWLGGKMLRWADDVWMPLTEEE